MAEVLSQQEIDQLLNNIKDGSGTSEKEKVSQEAILYDFRLPNRISKNQLRTIRQINENFAESLSSFLLSKLQSMVSVNVVAVDQIYYSEYVLSVSSPACLFTFDIRNYDIKGILELNTDFAFTLVDRLLCGSGVGEKQNKIVTPIEQKVLSVVVDKIMSDLKKCWAQVEELQFVVDRFEPDIDFAQITSQSESVLLISFEINIGNQAYMMNLCFSTFSFDELLTKISSQGFAAVRPAKYHGTTSQEIIKTHLLNTKIPVVVEFGKATLTVDELIKLELGDLVKLNIKIGDEHPVRVANKLLFSGKCGMVNDHKAIKITKKLENFEKS